MTRSHIIPHKIPQYQTVADIEKGSCPTCHHSLSVQGFHIGGYSLSVPHVVCQNPLGGWTSEHVKVRIDEQLAQDYADFVEWQEVEFGCWQEEQGEYPEEVE